MDSPDTWVAPRPPWLFGRQGLLVVAVVLGVAAEVGVPDLAVLGACLLALGLLARGWAAAALARLTFGREVSARRAFCGENLVLESRLDNPKPLPLPWAEVWQRLPADLVVLDGPWERSTVDPRTVWVMDAAALWPYRRVRWRRRLHCRRRGVFDLHEQWLRTGDPFGLVERQAAPASRQEVVVYPRVVPLRHLALPLHHASLDASSRRSLATDPTRTAALRDYRPDDPRRLIHWPTTARRGTLQVRVLEPTTSLRVVLVLDLSGWPMGMYREVLLEQAISALASIACYLQAQGQAVALLVNSRPPLNVPPGTSVEHLRGLLEALARLRSEPGPPLLSLAQEALRPGSSLVLATSDLASELDGTLAGLRGAGWRSMVLLSTAGGWRGAAFGGRPSSAAAAARAAALVLTPGADVAAVLEGRS